MLGVIHENVCLPEFPNIWPYNTENLYNAALGTKLLMSNKLVKKAKRSVFHVVSVGLRDGEAVVQWEVCIDNIRVRMRQHEKAQDMLQKNMYQHEAGHMNGNV